MPGPAEVLWVELALDYEAFVGRALLASPYCHLRGTRLLLGERAQVLRKAAGLVERHLVAGTLLCGAPLGTVSLPPTLGGRVCAGLSARPFFAARHEVMLQLMRVATHCRDTWVRRLRTPARGECAFSAFVSAVHTAAAAAARQGKHGRDLVSSGASLLAAVQTEAGTL